MAALVVWLAAGCASTAPPIVGPATPPPAVDETLGVEDLFEVRVFGEQELSGAYRVAGDGSIDFPLVGRVAVAGLTPPAVSTLLGERLRDGRFLVSPQVSLLVKEWNSKRVSVFGQVQRPGTFPYQHGMHIIQAITLAGGFTAIADEDGTTVTRLRQGRESARRVQAESIGRGRSPNFWLQPGDTVFVPEDPM